MTRTDSHCSSHACVISRADTALLHVQRHRHPAPLRKGVLQQPRMAVMQQQMRSLRPSANAWRRALLMRTMAASEKARWGAACAIPGCAYALSNRSMRNQLTDDQQHTRCTPGLQCLGDMRLPCSRLRLQTSPTCTLQVVGGAVVRPAACYLCKLPDIPGKFQLDKVQTLIMKRTPVLNICCTRQGAFEHVHSWQLEVTALQPAAMAAFSLPNPLTQCNGTLQAQALGVPRGPAYAKLVAGESVLASNGKTVHMLSKPLDVGRCWDGWCWDCP